MLLVLNERRLRLVLFVGNAFAMYIYCVQSTNRNKTHLSSSWSESELDPSPKPESKLLPLLFGGFRHKRRAAVVVPRSARLLLVCVRRGIVSPSEPSLNGGGLTF